MLRTIVGENIRNMRKELGMTQEELGLSAAMDKAHVGKIERGLWNPSLGTLQTLAFELNVAPYDFFYESDGRHATADAYLVKRIVSYVGTGEASAFAALLWSDALTKLTVDDIENGAR